ncbi:MULTISPECIES: EF-hand domain-containing protein [unclassified Crossiella]|uniref:EF-hand domain-containing protein n=1 Tax=Crossiella sp. SN42 TaxID=2944808 RepID=UPI00207C4496|nr:EF-hand domain-containing protein [Crossiella sp. SN42]MCO1576207.1 EF-hand domain-containing protein [Crossiella sp. SN42]
MLSALQRENIGALFDVFDHSGLGRIEWADMERIALTVIARLGMTTEDPKCVLYLQAYRRWWAQLQHDAGHGDIGWVDRPSFISAFEKGMMAEPGYLDRVLSVGLTAFDAADTDGDEVLDEEELVTLYVASGLPKEGAIALFQQIDTDGDGKISRQEWLAASRETYVGDDPAGVGASTLAQNWLAQT